MPPGPKPTDPDKRQRTNAPTFETQTLDPDQKVKAPALPGARKLSAQTRAWYKLWCESVQAQQFLTTDWQRLWMVALLVNDFYATDDPKLRQSLMSEIRLNEERLGATPESRLRLRWKMGENDKKDERAARAEPRRKRRGDPRLALVEDTQA